MDSANAGCEKGWIGTRLGTTLARMRDRVPCGEGIDAPAAGCRLPGFGRPGVVLPGGGHKRTQSRDIRRAIALRIASVALFGSALLSGCASSDTFFLREDSSGRLYGPFTTAGMCDRYLPAETYRVHYLRHPLRAAPAESPVWTNAPIRIRLCVGSNEIPASAWTDEEREMFASADFQRFIAKVEPGALRGVFKDGKWLRSWILRVPSLEDALVERMPPDRDSGLPPLMWDEDVETHRVLSSIRIQSASFRDATMSEIIGYIRDRIREDNPRSNIRVKLESPSGGAWPDNSPKLNVHLSGGFSVLDLLDYLDHDFGLARVRFDGEEITLSKPNNMLDRADEPLRGSSPRQP